MDLARVVYMVRLRIVATLTCDRTKLRLNNRICTWPDSVLPNKPRRARLTLPTFPFTSSGAECGGWCKWPYFAFFA